VKSSAHCTIVARADLRLYFLVGLLMALFIGIGIAIGVRRGDWTFAVVAVFMMSVSFVLLTILRLEVSAEGVFYRNLSGSGFHAFEELEKAYLTVKRSDATPQGVAAFWLQPKAGRPVKINLRTFPTKAAAVLFAALENHQIAIEVPDLWPARRMAQQVRDAQNRMMGGGDSG
jgi:hypothetical protein